MAELTAKELFRAKNGDGVENVRDCEGQIIRPIAFTTKRYIGQDEKEHEVLIIKDGKSGGMFKTEVRAFIEKYRDYEESFGSEDDEEKPEIVISTENDKKYLVVFIKDNGIGIPKKNLRHIFDEFYRVPKGNIHDVKGYGIGLHYVKKIIQKHSGKIKVESELNHGSTFILYLPFK